MRSNPPIIIILQLMPIVVLILALTEPSAAIPIFIFLGILFPILLLKFFQQAFDDFDREMYARSQQKTKFQYWYDIPIDLELESDPEVKAFNPLQPYLYHLRLPYPYTLEQLNQAYRQRARETHPDVRGGSTQEFLQVREAYEVLKTALETTSSNVD
ncbi:MAG TPA: J domain-containing protein [Oscillatoriales cyanobacterium M59_W2019_021]|nr:MAG: hypothetical protein D6728_08620 [Cyanobacteria bacterium J055]HIK33947.1 J domain-containing protein [Oscillatoriales cyanobacterium M4454_W2019_049]HIK51654.1 J domain-containing protein [Oscillatoriales cyanobacterium M59_W2019_021]